MDIRVGDMLRLKTYEGHVGLGTPESHSVFKTVAEGRVTARSDSQRFGTKVRLDGYDEDFYLGDYDVDRVAVETCTHCGGRGFVKKES